MMQAYTPKGRVPLVPQRIARPANDNRTVREIAARFHALFPSPAPTSSRGSAGTDRLDCRSVPAAGFVPFHAAEIARD